MGGLPSTVFQCPLEIAIPAQAARDQAEIVGSEIIFGNEQKVRCETSKCICSGTRRRLSRCGGYENGIKKGKNKPAVKIDIFFQCTT